MFDTLTYANKHKEAVFTRHDTTQGIEILLSEFKHDLKTFELKLDRQFLILKWMLGFVLAGILSLVLKAFICH